MLKCKNYLYFALFALSALFVGFFIIPTPNANASSVTYTIDSSNYSSEFVFCDSSTCPSYRAFSLSFEPLSVPKWLQVSFYAFGRKSSMSYDTASNFSFSLGSSFVSEYYYYFYDEFTLKSFSYSQTTNAGSFYENGGKVFITLYDSDPMQGINPSGTLDITENGTFDVTNYASVSVDVPETECPTCPSGGSNNYHDDLVNIQKSIIICGAILLVLYFFYCIYRFIIRNSGVH